MSRIHDALKKLEAERAAGHGAGNGHGNGNGNGRRRAWQWLLSGRGKRNGHPAPVNFDLGPEAEEAYQRLGTSVLVAPPGGLPADQPKLLGVVGSRHGEGTTTTAAVFASILVRRRGGRVAVVEANLRTPSFPTAFGIRTVPGLAEVIEGKATLADAAQTTAVPNLFAITAGESTLPAATLFDSPALPAVLA